MSDSPQIRLRPRETSEAICGFCRDTFLPEEEVQACEGCEAPFHGECWRDELQEQCTTLGCNNEKPARGPRRFHALRGRLRRRRRRRLLDGGMAKSGTTHGHVFVLGSVLALLTAIGWAISTLQPGDLGMVVTGTLVTLGAGAALAYARIRSRERD